MALLEGFESFSGGIPNTLSWSDSSSAGLTISQETTHVTQGTYTMRCYTADGSANLVFLDTPYNVDVTEANTVYMDYYVAAAGDTGGVYKQWALYITDFDENSVSASTPSNIAPPFSGTLEIDLTPLPGRTGLKFIIADETLQPGEADIYFDNLRDDTGGGGSVTVPVIMQSYRKLRA